MRKTLLLLVFLLLVFLGCGGGSPAVSSGNPDAGDDGASCEDTVVEVPLEPRSHIQEGTPPVYVNNPPVSGEHYGESWARWQIYTTEVPRGYWVHNLEHGGVIFLYRKASVNGQPDAPQTVIAALISAYNKTDDDPSPECRNLGYRHKRIVMTPDSLLPSDLPWAVVVSGPEYPGGSPNLGVGYLFKGSCVNVSSLKSFTESHRDQGAETRCDHGLYAGGP